MDLLSTIDKLSRAGSQNVLSKEDLDISKSPELSLEEDMDEPRVVTIKSFVNHFFQSSEQP